MQILRSSFYGMESFVNMAMSEQYQDPNKQNNQSMPVYMKFDCLSFQLSYVLSSEKQHWVNDINTNNQPMWIRFFELEVIGTILSVMKNNKKLAKLENKSGKKPSRRK